MSASPVGRNGAGPQPIANGSLRLNGDAGTEFLHTPAAQLKLRRSQLVDLVIRQCAGNRWRSAKGTEADEHDFY